jgi:hypothetical protein
MAEKGNGPRDRRNGWKRPGAGAHAAPAFASNIMTLVAWALLFDEDEKSAEDETSSEPSE